MTSLTLRVPQGEFKKLKDELNRQGFVDVSPSQALWSVKKDGTSLALFPSGTLLLQGKDSYRVRDIVLTLLDNIQQIEVGCDESGKGDVFGPLVLCCAILKPEYFKKTLSLNMRDCKRMRDEEVIRKAHSFRSFGEYRCISVEPHELNQLHAEHRNLNRILDRLYGELIVQVSKNYPSARLMVDAYAKKNPFSGVIFEPDGENDLAVATASVLARAEFLKWLKEHNLPKGSSPQALQYAQRLYREDPAEAKRLLKTFFL